MKSDYLDQYKIIHSETDTFGTSSIEFLYLVELIIKELKPKSVLDYGCGRSRLVEELKINSDIKRYRYDPAVKEYSVLPVEKVDFVINTDVLEHIPEEHLDELLSGIKSISENVFFNISNRLANKVLPNGENAHCTVKPPKWWQKKLESRFGFIQRLVCNDRTASMFITFKTPLLFRLRFNLYNTGIRVKNKIKEIKKVIKKIFF